MAWSIHYHTEAVESFVLGLPPGLLARYLRLTDMMLEFGANLGMPHTQALSDGLFELRGQRQRGDCSGVLLHAGRPANHHVAWVH